MSTSLTYEIRECGPDDDGTPAVTPDKGGIRLGLFLEGKRIATAGASQDVLDDMQHTLGLDRAQVTEQLRGSLQSYLTSQLDKVTVTELRPDPTKPLLFHARYTYRDDDVIDSGVVSYDVGESKTFDSQLPALIRNRMRQEVHRRLTTPGSAARALVDMHR